MFFWGSNAWTGWCVSLGGKRVPSDFPRISSKESHKRVLCLPCVCPNRFECKWIQDVFCTRSSKNIEILLQEWPMLVEWTHHLSSFEVSALEGGDACFTEMLKARISIVHLGILWSVCGGGQMSAPKDAKKLQLQASERRRCFFSTIVEEKSVLGDSIW